MSDPRVVLSSLGGNTPPAPEPTPEPVVAPPMNSAPPSARPAPPPSAGPPASAAPTMRATYQPAPVPVRRAPVRLYSGVGALLALGGMTAFALKPAAPATVPTGYTPFSAPDGVFVCDTPNGWTNQPTGTLANDDRSNTQNGIVMQSGDAQTEVTLSTAAALAHAQLLFGSSTVPESLEGGRAKGVNKLHRRAVKKRFADYKEKEVADCPYNMGGGYFGDDHKLHDDALLFEFTGKSGLLGRVPVHGYRAVVGGRDLIASVECHCSESEWAKMKPTFRHLIGNLREVHPVSPEEAQLKQMLNQMDKMPKQPGS